VDPCISPLELQPLVRRLAWDPWTHSCSWTLDLLDLLADPLQFVEVLIGSHHRRVFVRRRDIAEESLGYGIVVMLLKRSSTPFPLVTIDATLVQG
jgi:hypothetical protein